MSRNHPRPELLACEYWSIQKDGTTTAYCVMDGESPVIMNHLSAVTYRIIEGTGKIALDGYISKFEVEAGNPERRTVAQISWKQRYQWSGQFSAMVEWPLPPVAGFVTFDEEKLSDQAALLLPKVRRGEVVLRLPTKLRDMNYHNQDDELPIDLSDRRPDNEQPIIVGQTLERYAV